METFKIFWENIIQFEPKLKEKKAKELHKKLSDLAASMPEHFAKQSNIEKIVTDNVKKIHAEGKNKFALPHLQSQYQPGTHSIEVLSFHTPMFHKHDTKPFGGHDYDRVALRHSLENRNQIVSHIDDKLNKFKELRKIADQAPAKQFPHRTINYAETNWQRMKDHFTNLKEYNE